MRDDEIGCELLEEIYSVIAVPPHGKLKPIVIEPACLVCPVFNVWITLTGMVIGLKRLDDKTMIKEFMGVCDAFDKKLRCEMEKREEVVPKKKKEWIH